jgi:ABC-type Zn uptake system ZnuABC Zn-binding protein ZnuA
MRHHTSTASNRIIKIALLFISLFCLQVAKAQKKPLVVATTSVFADMAKNIAGDAVEVSAIVPIGSNPHPYKPTPGDAQLVAAASLLLRNDLTYENWLDDLIAEAGTAAEVATITEGIKKIENKLFKNSIDPHAWMDPALGLIYIENIKNALIELVPDEKQMFEFNYGVYRQQLQDMDRYIQQQLQTLPEKGRIIITTHDAFRYYGRRYQLQTEAILGVTADSASQSSVLKHLNRFLKKKEIPAIFLESTIDSAFLQQFAKDNQLTINGKLYSDSVGDAKTSANSYLDLLKYNTDAIVKALRKNADAAAQATNKKIVKPRLGLVAITGMAVLSLIGFFLIFKRLNRASN